MKQVWGVGKKPIGVKKVCRELKEWKRKTGVRKEEDRRKRGWGESWKR